MNVLIGVRIGPSEVRVVWLGTGVYVFARRGMPMAQVLATVRRLVFRSGASA